MPARATRISRVAAITGLGIPCSGWAGSPAAPADRAAAERAFALAEELGSVNAAAQELGYHLAVAAQGAHPPRPGHAGPNPEAVRRRAIAAARHRNGQPAPQATQPLDLVFMALNHGQLPPPRGPQPEQGVRLRRAEEIETLSYRTVVALNQESRLAPRWRIATIARRAERRQAERAARTRHSSRAHHWPEERGMLTDAR
jgi:hypothetical protein